MDEILRQPETGFFPWARKRRFDEEEDDDNGPTNISKRAARSTSVCMILSGCIYAPRMNDIHEFMSLECSFSRTSY